MAESATGNSPWWAVPLVGLIGTLVGALISFASTWRATSRQLLRQEQTARREMYAKWIEAVTTCRDRCLDLSRTARKVDEIRSQVGTAFESRSDNPFAPLADQVKELESSVRTKIKEVEATHERGQLVYYELTLYAPPALREAAATAHHDLLELIEAVKHQDAKRQDAAESRVVQSVATFTVLGRADVAAPAGAKLRSVARRLPKLADESALEAEQGGKALPTRHA